MTPTMYRTQDVPVRGGSLRVGRWGDSTASRTVLAVHGVTSNHLAWESVATGLTRHHPDVQLVAVDLRGRGHSADLPGPWGMAQHADDLTAVVAAIDAARVSVVGHSMGAFVAIVFAHRHASLVDSVLLVDGGIPLPVPDGVDPIAAATALLGPAAERLRQVFPDRAAYHAFWRAHPAFTGWTPAIERYVDYDLAGTPPELHSRCAVEAMEADTLDLADPAELDEAWRAQRVPVRLLRAPAGLLNEPPGLYPTERLDAWAREHGGFTWQTVDDVNHYTITLGERGARAVIDAIAGRA